ncbi:MAG: hypothetical protein PHT02_12370 [Tissierellia bacterium]|nr:hypothetical protein [Tissierellia bacterium]
MRKFIGIILLINFAIAICSCSKQISFDAYEKLIENLENMNYTIKAEDVEEDILNGERKWLTVDENANISVYLYVSSDEMEKDASYISDDGFTYDNGKHATTIEWVSYPHFFKSENMIILYVADNLEIIQTLEKLVGPQFAGEKLLQSNFDLQKEDQIKMSIEGLEIEQPFQLAEQEIRPIELLNPLEPEIEPVKLLEPNLDQQLKPAELLEPNETWGT